MSKSRDQIREWTRLIDVTGKTVLDVGAGSERKHVKHFVQGTAKSFEACDLEPKEGIDFTFDLNEPLETLKEYDYVFCLETLEHIWNPLQAIETLSKLTKEKLFISTPFYNPLHDVHDYLRYTLQWYQKVLPKYSFKRIKITPRVATVGKDSLARFLQEEGLRMSKITYKAGYGRNFFDIGYCIEAIK